MNLCICLGCWFYCGVTNVATWGAASLHSRAPDPSLISAAASQEYVLWFVFLSTSRSSRQQPRKLDHGKGNKTEEITNGNWSLGSRSCIMGVRRGCTLCCHLVRGHHLHRIPACPEALGTQGPFWDSVASHYRFTIEPSLSFVPGEPSTTYDSLHSRAFPSWPFWDFWMGETMIEALHQLCTTSPCYRQPVLGLGQSCRFLCVQFGGSQLSSSVCAGCWDWVSWWLCIASTHSHNNNE